MDERIPFLTVAERAELLGQSFGEQLRLEREQPWVRHWSARFGAGADRLRSWLAGGHPQAVRGDLCVVGDPAIVRAVRAVVEKLPEAVAHFLVGNALIVCSGVSTHGWCGEMPALPCTVSRLIALATADAPTLLHELAHCWQVEGWPPDARLTAEQLERLRTDLAAEPGGCAFVDEHEHAATALGNLWLTGSQPT